jgi:hypothetical protein
MAPLFDSMEEFTAHERAVIKSRFIPMIDATERTAIKAEWWDTRMFLMGFGASLVVTIGAAVNIAGFITPAEKNIVGVAVLVLSSIGTAALGLRERLKFQEVSIIARKMSNKLQRRGFLFLARADPYAAQDRQEAYASFITHTERIKLQADEDNLKLKAEKEEDGGKPGGMGVGVGVRVRVRKGEGIRGGVEASVGGIVPELPKAERTTRVVTVDFADDQIAEPLPQLRPPRHLMQSQEATSPSTRVEMSALAPIGSRRKSPTKI